MSSNTNVLQNPAWENKDALLRRARDVHMGAAAQAAYSGPVLGDEAHNREFMRSTLLQGLAAASNRTLKEPKGLLSPAMAQAARGAIKSKVNVQIEEADMPVANKIIDTIADDTLTREEKERVLNEIDPPRRVVQQIIASGEADLQRKHAERDRHEKLVRSYQRAMELMRAGDGMYVLQKNECSRLHKFVESCQRGMFYDNHEKAFCAPQAPDLGNAQVIVVRHDWAAAFGDNFDFDPADPFKLPFPKVFFEFRISGITVIASYNEAASGERVETALVFEGVDGIWWSAFEGDERLHEYVERQVRAICVALEAQVAEHTVTRAPAKLNAKREREGKPPLADFLVVDLARRIRARSRAERRPDAQPTGRRVRLHFRRGHWRHYETHRTWIEWMLVGDPDLGFIDKHYRV